MSLHAHCAEPVRCGYVNWESGDGFAHHMHHWITVADDARVGDPSNTPLVVHDDFVLVHGVVRAQDVM